MKNKSSVTRKQHFVHRQYLSSWTNDQTTIGKAYITIKGKKSDNIKLTNILFENCFYKIPVLNFDEINVCKQILKQLPFLDEKCINIYYDCLKLTTKIDKYVIDENNKRKMHSEMIQLGEDFQICGENMLSNDVRKAILNCDSSFLSDCIEKKRFLNYISSQYYRTPKIKKKFIESSINLFINKNLNFENIWLVMQGAFASSMANYMERCNFGISFVVSEKEELITNDNPITELDFSSNGVVRFYYPFSPRVGLVIGADENNEIKILDGKSIQRFNDIINNNADRFIVERYKNVNTFDN